MSFFGKLFSSDTLINSGIKAIDAAFFTKQEKAEWQLKALAAYEPFKLAQRYIALIVTMPFCVIHAIAGLQIIISGWLNGPMGKAVHEASLSAMEYNNDTLGLPVAIVLGFYFGGGMIEGAIRAKAVDNKKPR